MSKKETDQSEKETISTALPRELVEQLIEYDPKLADLFGVDGYIAAICQEWLGEKIILRTKVRVEELLPSETEKIEKGTKDKPEDKQPYIFQVRNHHVSSCGTPPHFDDPDGVYLSYYENQYGEQNIFLYHYETKEAFLYMGDAGWDRPRKVIEGGKVPGLIYGEDEASWLFACWVATHFEEAMQMFRDTPKKGKRKQ